MKVTERLTFEEYWNDSRFSRKKPSLNGSLKQIHGDNIYYQSNQIWCQLDSHHSLYHGKLNEANRDQDLSGEYVLVSDQFIYLGDHNIVVPEKYRALCPNARQRDYITIHDEQLAIDFIQDMKTQFGFGLHGFPINWKEYDQRSLF